MARADDLALLRWYAAMGVDEALDEAPRDWFLPELPSEPDAPAVGPAVLPAPGADGAAGARLLAGAAADLDALRLALEGFDGLELKKTAMRLVFADGVPGSRLMLVGEAPGREEDREGLPFVGPSGRLLDRMLAAIGLDRRSVYIANVIPWRPPGNRTPTPEEVQVCLPFIERQIELAKPDVLVLLGGAPAAALLGVRDGIMRLRGKWRTHEVGGRTLRVLPTLHPAYLLRQPGDKRLAWRDLRAVRRALDGAD